MTELMRFSTDRGSVVVEVDDDEPGFEPVSRGSSEIVKDTKRHLVEALNGVREAAEETLGVFTTGALRPTSVELEFGVKLNAEAGAIITKTAVEGHFTVKVTWEPGPGDKEIRASGE
jgi:hypothetical protein